MVQGCFGGERGGGLAGAAGGQGGVGVSVLRRPRAKRSQKNYARVGHFF